VAEGTLAVREEAVLVAGVRVAAEAWAVVVREAVAWVREAREAAAMVMVVETATVGATGAWVRWALLVPAAVLRVAMVRATAVVAWWAVASVHTRRNRSYGARLIRWRSQRVC
jgi:hypothetical protein